MSNNRDKQVHRKLINHIDHTLEYCEGVDFDAFMNNRMLQEACVFNVLQIGELSRNALSVDFKEAHRDIPWRQMYGLRNRIVHDYEGVRLRKYRTIWTAVWRCLFRQSSDADSLIYRQ